MGYRHYFTLIEKDKLEELKNLTMEQLKQEYDLLEEKVMEGRDYTYREHDGEKVFDLMDYAYHRLKPLKYGMVRIHELGKLYFQDTETRLLKSCKKIDFKDKELKDIVESDNLCVIASNETLKEYARICAEKMLDYYKSLLTTEKEFLFGIKFDEGKDKTEEEKAKMVNEKMRNSIEHQIRLYEITVKANQEPKNDGRIFENETYESVLAKMKTLVDFGVIDFKKYELLLLAW
jgi:hypothetical protein